MIHDDFAFLDPLIEMEQWCTRGLAEDYHSLLVLWKTLSLVSALILFS